MGNWKNLLAPLLTCLIVACLAVLPTRLSAVKDQALSGTVHAEALGEDSNFPAKPPELPGRLWLLAQLESWPDTLTVVYQELPAEEIDALTPGLQGELAALEAAWELPEGLLTGFQHFSGSRIYLRDQRDLSSACFLELSDWDTERDESLSLFLDRETGRVAALELGSRAARKTGLSAAEAGGILLDRLGAAYERVDRVEEDGGGWTLLRLTEERVLYEAALQKAGLRIVPQMDWAALEPEDGAVYDLAYGLDTDS